MLATNLVERDLYLQSIAYIKNVKIVEYDLKSAGFNILKEYNLIDGETVNELENLPKKERTIKIGKLMKENKNLSLELTKKFAEVRKIFVEQNNIQEEEVLSIKKDAIFLINRTITNTKIGKYLEFVPKNTYTSFIKINDMEMYFDGLTKILDIKNFKPDFILEGDISKGGELFELNINEHPIIEDLKRFLLMSEKLSQKDLFNSLKLYRRKYINRQLSIETYRDLHSGIYHLVNSEVKLLYVDEENKSEIDILPNYLSILRPFLAILI